MADERADDQSDDGSADREEVPFEPVPEASTAGETSGEGIAEATGGKSGTDGGGGWAALNTALTVVLALALVASMGGVVYVAVTPQQTGEQFTEFYVFGPDGNASGYPTNLTTGESGEVIVGVTNNERRDVDYRVEVTWNGATTMERRLRVPRGETRETRLDVTAPDEPGRYRVRFNLYVNNGSDSVYRQLRLIVHVENES
jgi:uncharacterized membrane protein